MRRRIKKNMVPLVIGQQKGWRYSGKTDNLEIINSLSFSNVNLTENGSSRVGIAVVLHIYYAELWNEIASYLDNIEDDYDLYVSLVREASDHLEPEIKTFCPGAHVSVFPNHGRDIYPFIAFLNHGVLDKYELVLKIHSKLTFHDVEQGRLWRQRLLDGLLGTPERVRGIITSFRVDPGLGLVGPRYRVIGPGDPNWRWEWNAPGLRWLEQHTGIPGNWPRATFVAGTMFWCRPKALSALQGTLEPSHFDPEPLPADGMFQHAVERFFGVVAGSRGYSVKAVEGLPFCGEKTVEPLVEPRDVLSVESRNVRPVQVEPGDRVCLFACYSSNGRIWDHTKEYCRRLRGHGLKVILVVATDRSDLGIEDPGHDVCDSLIVRENAGFDFASWAFVLRGNPVLWSASSLFFANDSVYGPFGDFRSTLDLIENSNHHYTALIKSYELQPHFQSFFFAITGDGLKNPEVHRFWQDVKILETKREIIAAYELAMLSRFSRAGLQCQPLFDAKRWGEDFNPTLCRWRELIESGFPFIKIELLRDNPGGVDLTGWDCLLRSKGYDLELIHKHLRAVRPGASALRNLYSLSDRPVVKFIRDRV